MKTNTQPTFVQTNNVGETSQATIKASAMMFNMLSKQIYSNYHVAIWRELVANGVDAQKITGETRSPIISVPSILEPYAKVRDFGTGMGHRFMMDNFMSFGDASTKSDSNDLIGGYGIGSKAPLSYTDQYSIRSFRDGTVRVYSVFKDETGCPSIAFLSEASTDEPNGVEVGFPVRQEDISDFQNAVIDTCQYFEPLPVLENTSLKLDPVQYDVRGDKWGLRMSSPDRSPRLIIGGVSYPMNTSVPFEYENLRNYIGLGLDIYLEIGDAEIAASRESVVQDAALYAKLDALTQDIGVEFSKQVVGMFADCKTEWEAKLLLDKILAKSDHYARNLIRKYAEWNGDKIKTLSSIRNGFEVLAIFYTNSSVGYNDLRSFASTQAVSPKFRSCEGAEISPSILDRIIIDDGPVKPSLRIRGIVEQNPNEKILFIRPNGDKPFVWDDYFKAMGNPPKSLITKLSDYAPIKLARRSGGSSARSFKYYSGWGKPFRGEHPNTGDLPKGGGLYLRMDNFNILSSLSDMEIAKQTKPENVIWLNVTDYNSSGVKSDPEWYSVEEGIAKAKANYCVEHKRLAEAEAYYQWMGDNQSLARELDRLSTLAKFPKRGPLAQLKKLRDAHSETATSPHSTMRREILNVNYEKQTAKFVQLQEAYEAKHPLLAEMFRHNIMGNLSDDLINVLF